MDTTLVASIQLLGRVRARLGSAVTDFLPDKRFQLLAYLAYRAGLEVAVSTDMNSVREADLVVLLTSSSESLL